MTYGEFLRRESEPPFKEFSFGDMYSFGASRVCLQPFAEEVKKRTLDGSRRYLFRIVNKNDPVCTVPPRTSSQQQQYPFIHVSGAWELAKSGPSKMADEPPPVAPQPVDKITWNIRDHRTSSTL